MDSIVVTEKKYKGFTVLGISGQVNSYTHNEFEKAVYTAVRQGDTILDLSSTVTISSFGLGILMTACEDATDAGTAFYILNPSKLAWLAVESTGFSDIFKIIHSLEEAESSVK